MCQRTNYYNSNNFSRYLSLLGMFWSRYIHATNQQNLAKILTHAGILYCYYIEKYWIGPGDITQQSSSCTATYHPLRKLSKFSRTRHVEHCWRIRDEFISYVHLWTPSHEREKAGQPARIYIQQLCANMGCSPEDLPEAMEGMQERSGISVLVARHDDDGFLSFTK